MKQSSGAYASGGNAESCFADKHYQALSLRNSQIHVVNVH
jgi:hypothetical protein